MILKSCSGENYPPAEVRSQLSRLISLYSEPSTEALENEVSEGKSNKKGKNGNKGKKRIRVGTMPHKAVEKRKRSSSSDSNAHIDLQLRAHRRKTTPTQLERIRRGKPGRSLRKRLTKWLTKGQMSHGCLDRIWIFFSHWGRITREMP
jgi:hypothetical protein